MGPPLAIITTKPPYRKNNFEVRNCWMISVYRGRASTIKRTTMNIIIVTRLRKTMSEVLYTTGCQWLTSLNPRCSKRSRIACARYFLCSWAMSTLNQQHNKLWTDEDCVPFKSRWLGTIEIEQKYGGHWCVQQDAERQRYYHKYLLSEFRICINQISMSKHMPYNTHLVIRQRSQFNPISMGESTG